MRIARQGIKEKQVLNKIAEKVYHSKIKYSTLDILNREASITLLNDKTINIRKNTLKKYGIK